MGLAASRGDEVAVREAELAAARADEALARAVRILPGASATLVAGPAPRARGDVVESPDSNRALRGLRPFGRVDVEAVQPLYTWGRLDAAADAAAAGTRARARLVDDAAAQARLRAAQLYWGIALARRLLGVAADVERALDEADRRIAAALAADSGEVVASDRYRVDLFRALLRSRAAEAQRGLELARIGLAAGLGVPAEQLRLREEPLDPGAGEPPDAAEARAAAERRRPDLRALGDAIAAREAEARAERAARWPQLFLAGSFRFGYAGNRDLQRNPWVHDDFNLLTAGAVVGLRQDLAVPTLNARVEKAEAERAALERQRAGLARLVEVQVDGALADLRAARARHLAAQAALGSGRSLFRSAGLDFAAGLLEARTLLESYALYVESQVGAAQAAHDLLVARARLDQVTGEAPRREATCQLP